MVPSSSRSLARIRMDLRSGRHVVDAKSILGIFSLDWSKPVTMEIYSDDCDDLLAEIKPFLA